MFDPWKASLQDALKAQAEWESVGRAAFGPDAPLHQFAAAERVKLLQVETEAGGLMSGFATLAAVRACLAFGLIAPEWLVVGFVRRYDAVLNCRAISWDDSLAFGRPYKAGKHKAALRKARMTRFAVLTAVRDVRACEPATPIGPELFKRVGLLLGLGKTLAERYYYEAVALSPAPPLAPGRRIIKMSSAPANSTKFTGRVVRRR